DAAAGAGKPFALLPAVNVPEDDFTGPVAARAAAAAGERLAVGRNGHAVDRFAVAAQRRLFLAARHGPQLDGFVFARAEQRLAVCGDGADGRRVSLHHRRRLAFVDVPEPYDLI